jgi:hypothetical protein
MSDLAISTGFTFTQYIEEKQQRTLGPRRPALRMARPRLLLLLCLLCRCSRPAAIIHSGPEGCQCFTQQRAVRRAGPGSWWLLSFSVRNGSSKRVDCSVRHSASALRSNSQFVPVKSRGQRVTDKSWAAGRGVATELKGNAELSSPCRRREAGRRTVRARCGAAEQSLTRGRGDGP